MLVSAESVLGSTASPLDAKGHEISVILCSGSPKVQV